MEKLRQSILIRYDCIHGALTLMIVAHAEIVEDRAIH